MVLICFFLNIIATLQLLVIIDVFYGLYLAAYWLIFAHEYIFLGQNEVYMSLLLSGNTILRGGKHRPDLQLLQVPALFVNQQTYISTIFFNVKVVVA